MTTIKDYYKILGIEKGASLDEIKRAYRKLAKKHHPDINKHHSATEKFKEITEAFSTLKDTQKREEYDSIWTATFDKNVNSEQNDSKEEYTNYKQDNYENEDTEVKPTCSKCGKELSHREINFGKNKCSDCFFEEQKCEICGERIIPYADGYTKCRKCFFKEQKNNYVLTPLNKFFDFIAQPKVILILLLLTAIVWAIYDDINNSLKLTDSGDYDYVKNEYLKLDNQLVDEFTNIMTRFRKNTEKYSSNLNEDLSSLENLKKEYIITLTELNKYKNKDEVNKLKDFVKTNKHAFLQFKVYNLSYPQLLDDLDNSSKIINGEIQKFKQIIWDIQNKIDKIKRITRPSVLKQDLISNPKTGADVNYAVICKNLRNPAITIGTIEIRNKLLRKNGCTI